MASHLLAAAFACDDETLLDEAMSHTATEGMQDATDEAISHKSCLDPDNAGGKKRQSGGAVGGTAAKKNKPEPMFHAATGADGMLQCMFVEGEYVPLWPQYADRIAKCNFVRVGAQEEWVIQFMVASRKAVVQEKEKDEPPGKKKMWTRKFVKCVCDELLCEFKRAVLDARTNPAEPTGQHESGLLGIKMHGCDVIASAHARHFCIQATAQSVAWIQNGLKNRVKAYIDRELRAMGQAVGEHVPSMLNMRAGVREKIMWMPETCRWSLKFKGEIGEDKIYCKANRINLAIQTHLCDAEFLVAREKAFLDAARVWNAIDKSGRKRITVPERPLQVQMVPVPYSEAMSHTDSDRESEHSDRDEHRDV